MEIQEPALKLSIIFNNIAFDDHLRTSWGFSCLVEIAAQETILFDTGGSGEIVLANMRRMNKDPMAVGMVFLSHAHDDHTGGLKAFLRQNHHIRVCLPESFPPSFMQSVKRGGGGTKPVGAATALLNRVHSSGQMGDRIKEQALIIETANGLVVITGCAHPGIAHVVEKAKKLFKRDVYLVAGGFHLKGMSPWEVDEIIGLLKKMGVTKVAPSHCTGEEAMARFKGAWKDDFLEGGAGAIIQVPGQ